MFKQILIILFILIIFYFIIKNILISTHKLYLDSSKIKYTLYDSDKEYLKKYSTDCLLSELEENSIFYTQTKWSTRNNNYLKFKDTFFIIEPGYYYYYLPETEIFINNNCKVFLLKKNKKVT